jgi:hypothetical protein
MGEKERDCGGGESIRCVIVDGPFSFSFTVPVEPGRVAELGQTVEASGVEVTLERVVVTPTGARVLLRGAGPSASVTLSVDGESYELYQSGAVPLNWEADSSWDYITEAQLLDERGEWTLTVKELVARYEPNGSSSTLGIWSTPGSSELELDQASKQERIQGPWTFKFTVPPVSMPSATETQP